MSGRAAPRRPYYRYITEVLQGPQSELCSVVLTLPLKPRKSLVLMCRARHNPYHDRLKNTTLWRLTQPFWLHLRHHNYSTRKMVLILDTVLSRPMFAGFILSMTVSSPISIKEAKQISDDMYLKEIMAMERPRRIGSVDWLSLMTRPEYELNTGFSNSRVTTSIRKNIDAWHVELQSDIIFPRSGVKLLAHGSVGTLGGDSR